MQADTVCLWWQLIVSAHVSQHSLLMAEQEWNDVAAAEVSKSSIAVATGVPARLEHSVLQMLVKQNAEIKEELKTIKATMFELLRRQKGLEAVRTDRLPAGIQLPLKTQNDVAAVEEQLVSPELYSQVVGDLLYMKLWMVVIYCCTQCSVSFR